MSDDLIGKLVRWEDDGQWFTARVTGPGSGLYGSLSGKVVDPGNFVGVAAVHPYFAEQRLKVGESVPNLLPDLLAVVEEEVSDVQ